jgi:hypothetical protein
MSAIQTRTIYCDGCTVAATPEHLRRRIARLEWTSRYRPIHITTLLLAPAPPAALEDFFYAPERLAGDEQALAFYEDVLAACGVSASGETKERALAEFQRGGYFLAEAVECPVEEGTDFDSLVSRLTPTILRRARFSYRPKSVLVLSECLAGVAKALGEAGIETNVMLWDDKPVKIADAGDAEARKRFRDEVSALLAGRG